MILAITYGDDNFSQSNDYNLYTAKKYGNADKTIMFGPKDLDDHFRKENADILKSKRGAGYWLWKPYVINKAITMIDYGDYLVYADSGSFYTRDLNELIEFMKDNKTDVFLGQLEHEECCYSKRDAFVLLDVDTEEIAHSNQYEASFLLIKKTELSEKIIRDWLLNCCDIRIISDNPNVCGKEDYPNFIENRYDQTVLSLIAKKNGIIGYRPIDTKKNALFKESTYSQCIVRTRFRNTSPLKFRIKIAFKWLKFIFNA